MNNFMWLGKVTPKLRPWLWSLVKVTVLLAALIFLFWELAANVHAISQLGQTFRFTHAAMALLLLLGAFALLPLLSRESLASLGHSLGYRSMFRAYFASQLLKYLPGGFWVVPGRVVVLQPLGVDPISSSVGVVVESLILLFAGATVFLPYGLLITGGRALFASIGVLSIGMATLGVVRSSLFHRILERVSPALAQQRIASGFTVRPLLKMTLIGIAFWLLAGSGLYFLTAGVEEIPLKMWVVATAAFSMAWVTGFLAFLTPGGLGVREATLIWLLTPFLPRPTAVLVALLARLWWTLAEALTMAIAAFFGRQPDDKRESEVRTSPSIQNSPLSCSGKTADDAATGEAKA
jgi:uncharacterized membrane protein YbhN (UPF0104 family)